MDCQTEWSCSIKTSEGRRAEGLGIITITGQFFPLIKKQLDHTFVTGEHGDISLNVLFNNC